MDDMKLQEDNLQKEISMGIGRILDEELHTKAELSQVLEADGEEAAIQASEMKITEAGEKKPGWFRRHGKLLKTLTTLIKFGFALALTLLAGRTSGSTKILVVSLMELASVFFVSNALAKNKLGWIPSGLLLILYNIQEAVMIFGNTYVSMVMLTNLASIEDIGGNAVLYIGSAAAVLITSFLPMRHFKLPLLSSTGYLSMVLAAELVLSMLIGNAYSPYFVYVDLARQKYENDKRKEAIANSDADAEMFAQKAILNHRQKPETIPENANVILIFAEGLTQNIVDDPRGIMPNLKAFQQQYLNFTNYYNHTIATYRGLIGQLYSGYQEENYDENHLVGMQDVFKEYGYKTAFINTEPNNAPFTVYLNSMGFDQIIGEPGTHYQGMVNSMSDREAFDALYNFCKENEDVGEPYFCSIYTFGTHASLNSPDEVFGDGSDAELNKLYNLDYQFGQFVARMSQEGLLDDTVLVVTTDHCTYKDAGFTAAFPDHPTTLTVLDQIPFTIYYPGVQPETVDAAGRNSLDMAPTVCDLMDFSKPNYFLGVSLFGSEYNNTNYDTVFYIPGNIFSTRGAQIAPLSETEMTVVMSGIENYLAVKLR